MTPSRASIFTALFNLLSGVTNFVFKSQRFTIWTDLSPEQYPTLILVEPNEHYGWPAEVLIKNTLRATAVIYLNASADESVAPIQDLDNLLDAIDAAMAPSTGMDKAIGRQTLGNLVYNCRIEGEVVKASGDLDNVSLLVVPIVITVAQQIV